MNNSNYQVSILVDGNQVKEHTKDNKTFIEAKLGSEYSIKVKNNHYNRILAVISVDGINVITGKPATPDDTGYVISAYGHLHLQGYRKDTESGGRFKFTDKDSGYSKEIDGTGNNSGIIGVLIFAEKAIPRLVKELVPVYIERYVPYHYDSTNRYSWNYPYGSLNNSKVGSSTSAANNLSMLSYTCANDVQSSYNTSHTPEPPKFDAATTWGEEFKESLTYTDFEKGSLETTFNIYYATRNSLIKNGIIKEHVVQLPQSFPSAFAQPPSNWKK